ncbi:MAG: taurine dioxygenase [Fodinibius sp.]|nr:taurine dioxygenase [Fodinibius sp.]
MDYKIIDAQKITSMLFNDEEYVAEFCNAGVSSFDEFLEHYRTYLLERNMEDLRKAGHKIKPGAQMMDATEIVEEYEHAKQLLQNDASSDRLQDSVDKMNDLCTTVCNELSQLAKNQ